MRITHFLALFLLLAPSGVAAQTTDPTWTVGGTGGWARTWDDEGSIGTGWVLGGYTDRRLSKHVDLEVAADLVANKRTDSFRADGKTGYLSAHLIRRFGSRDANGFVMGGPALAIHRGTTRFSDGTFHNEQKSVNGGWMFGGGLAFRTRNGIEIAPIVRMTLMQIDDDSDPWSIFSLGVRVGLAK
jgi:hypothetical protein